MARIQIKTDADTAGVGSVFVVGNLPELREHGLPALRCLGFNADGTGELPGLLQAALRDVTVNELRGGHASFLWKYCDEFVEVHLLVVPECCSRHNSPHRPDAVYDLVQAHARGAAQSATHTLSDVVFCISDRWSAIGEEKCCAGLISALARPFTTYCAKTNRREGSHTFRRRTSWAVNGQRHTICAACDGTQVAFYSSTDQSVLVARPELNHLAYGVQRAAGLVDTPCNILNTSEFVATARRQAASVEVATEGARVSVEVIEGEDLREKGYGGIYGVGKAAAHPPALVILHYEPPTPTETVAWVGKGIVYDTGGLSIKSKEGMPGMKRDMGGAAAIMEAFFVVARTGSDRRIYALLCLAENAVGPLATRPDDVHEMFSGKTVEINNTDAEGRLVLADGVAHAAKQLNPDIILDMCTLTGAQGISTGKRHAAIVCNSDELEAKAIAAGRASGDLVFPIPYCPEFFRSEFKSFVADMKNSVANRKNAQSSCAAQFIANHLGEFSGQWLHVDMAAPSHKGEEATGYGVALLVTMFGSL